MVKHTDLPITVKTRLGWDDDSIKIVEVAERLQDVGIKAISIHAAHVPKCIKEMQTGNLLQL
ncbi:tRNA dihydrouridine synthase B [Nonlabens ulvanivorans]|uniref:tRNA dihydrouridine synthase B n=1 Tax=Nonlabens ulvanivorans TaxID=906888 RepID=A0A090WAA4_NONUL|nr:tRNA dihydrouridine synthase B [Nonlabens ulvanivorans]